MEKIWIKKELYILNYEFLKFMPFFNFYSIFYLIFINIFFAKITKKGNFLPAGADVVSGSSDELTRGTRVRRGAEATWQCRGWPTRGPGGAQGGHMAGGHASARVHVAARVGRHVAGEVGRWRALGYSGPWLGIGGGNAYAVLRPTI